MIVADLFAKLGLKVDKKSFSAADRLMKGIKSGLVALGVFQGAKFLVGMIGDTIELGDNLAKLSNQLGVGTEALQELEFAAQQSDVEFSSLSQGLKFLSKNAYAAVSGSKEMRKNFRQIGISVKDLKNKSPDQLLLDVAEAFEKLPQGQRIGRAMEIFGKQGAELVPFLNKGRKGIEELRAEARRLGILPDSEVQKLAEADDQIDKAKFAFRALKSQIVTAVLPAVMKLITRFQAWFAENREMIKLVVGKFLDGIVTFINVAIEGYNKISTAFREMAEDGADFGMVVSGAFKALIFVARLFQDVIVGVIQFIGYLGEEIGERAAQIVIFFMDMAGALKDGFTAAVDFVAAKFEEFFNWINEKINAIVDRFRELRDAPGAFLDFVTGDVESEALQNMGAGDERRAAAYRAMKANMPMRPATPAAANNFNAEISVVAPPGSTPEQLRPILSGAMEDFWNNKIREGATATGQ